MSAQRRNIKKKKSSRTAPKGAKGAKSSTAGGAGAGKPRAAAPRGRRRDEPPRERFSEVLRTRRQEMGLTLGYLAERAGCAKSYLSLVENERKPAPSDEICEALERTLKLRKGRLLSLAQLERTPDGVRKRLERLERVQREAMRALGTDLDKAYRSGKLRQLIEQTDSGTPRSAELEPIRMPHEVPLINSVAAGYPTEFTDLGYPARVADEYVRAPDLEDPDAFAARVVGESMAPDYREGDIVVFSPARDVASGRDCFCRLEPDHETTFKRVFLETGDDGEELIRLQPLNPDFPARVLPREQVAGLYTAVSVTRKL